MNKKDINKLGIIITVALACFIYLVTYLNSKIYSKELSITLSLISFICWIIVDYIMSDINFVFSKIMKTFILLSYIYILYEVTFPDYPRIVAIFIGIICFIAFITG